MGSGQRFLVGWQVDSTGAARTSGTVDTSRLRVGHAVEVEVAEFGAPYEAVCGTPLHEVSDSGWPPDGTGVMRACPTCSRLVDGR